MTKAEYEQFAKEIQIGGFYTNGLRPVGMELFSTVVCSKGPHPLGGNSFWVTRFGGHWYLGTWGVRHYQVPDDRSVVEICLAWLRRQPEGTSADFDEALKAEFHLVEFSYGEFLGLCSAAGFDAE
ncbi:MAG TPA: hypothetical protein VM165_08065 [Planctomycetaceae bacterium]|nr:hypothetical protein [Planctomycetaceae bacterium]